MAIILNFNTATLEGLVTTLSGTETTLDAALVSLASAQSTEDTSESGLNSSGTSVANTVAALMAPLSEFSVADRIQRDRRRRILFRRERCRSRTL